MSERLKDKVAIVFGAGQTPGETLGNGRAVALLFGQEGASVCCADRDLASAEETASMIRARGGAAIATGTDVMVEEQIKGAVDTCAAEFGKIDILHNNVGLASLEDTKDVAEFETSAFEKFMSINLRSVLLAAKYVVPLMRRQGSGSIINISSVSAVCSDEWLNYKASKAAMDAATHQLAMANARYGIRVNSIRPGVLDTPMAIEGLARITGKPRDQIRAERQARVPMFGRVGNAMDVAYAALFLASDEAGFITGVNLPVDGGQTGWIGSTTTTGSQV